MPEGFMTGSILSISMDYPANNGGGNDNVTKNSILYLLLQLESTNDNKLQQLWFYNVIYYAYNTPNSLRVDDNIMNVTGLLSLSSNALAVVGNVVYLAGHSLLGVAGGSLAPVSIYIPPPETQWLYPIGDHLLGVDGCTVADIWNGVTTTLPPPSFFDDNSNNYNNAFCSDSNSFFYGGSTSEYLMMIKSYDYGVLAVLGLSSSPLTLSLFLLETSQCPLDYIFYENHYADGMAAREECVPMQCVRLNNVCGPASARLLGSTQCACMPGYYRSQLAGGGCIQCPENYFCTGNTGAPTACPAHAVSVVGASSASECVCEPGFYPLSIQGGSTVVQICPPCPLNFWCYGYSTLPIPCITHSHTVGKGSSTPLQCICDDRTKGVTCTPCESNELCFLTEPQPSLVALQIKGWGPVTASSLWNNAFFLMMVAH